MTMTKQLIISKLNKKIKELEEDAEIGRAIKLACSKHYEFIASSDTGISIIKPKEIKDVLEWYRKKVK